MKETKKLLIKFLAACYNVPISEIKSLFKFIGVIEYDTPIMNKNKALAFKAFMDFGTIKESPEACMFAFNEYFYSFHNLTGEEFITIIKWEMKHADL